MSKKPIDQLIVSVTSDEHAIEDWLKDRSPVEIVQMDKSEKAIQLAAAAQMQNPESHIRHFT